MKENKIINSNYLFIFYFLQCEHRSEYKRIKESPRKSQREEYKKKETVVDHSANTPRQKTPQPKKSSCCC
jgi:hypothetical protein